MATKMVSSKVQAKSVTVTDSLHDRLRKATQKSKPSIVPTAPPPPPPKEEEVVPELRELIDDPKAQRAMIQMTEEYLAWGAQEKDAKEHKDALSAKIKMIVGDYGISKVMVGVNKVNYFNQQRKTIKAELLLQHGVGPQVIEACTKTTDSYTLRITAPDEWG